MQPSAVAAALVGRNTDRFSLAGESWIQAWERALRNAVDARLNDFSVQGDEHGTGLHHPHIVMPENAGRDRQFTPLRFQAQ